MLVDICTGLRMLSGICDACHSALVGLEQVSGVTRPGRNGMTITTGHSSSAQDAASAAGPASASRTDPQQYRAFESVIPIDFPQMMGPLEYSGWQEEQMS